MKNGALLLEFQSYSDSNDCDNIKCELSRLAAKLIADS